MKNRKLTRQIGMYLKEDDYLKIEKMAKIENLSITETARKVMIEGVNRYSADGINSAHITLNLNRENLHSLQLIAEKMDCTILDVVQKAVNQKIAKEERGGAISTKQAEEILLKLEQISTITSLSNGAISLIRTGLIGDPVKMRDEIKRHVQEASGIGALINSAIEAGVGK